MNTKSTIKDQAGISGEARLQCFALPENNWVKKNFNYFKRIIALPILKDIYRWYVRKNGVVKWDTGFMKNTLTTAGFAVFSGLAGDVDSQDPFTYLAVGDDSTAESDAHTALLSEIEDSGLARAAATVTRETTTETNDTLQLYHEWAATGTKTVEEIGIFNAASDGVMAARKLTTTKTVNDGELLQGTYSIKFASA